MEATATQEPANSDEQKAVMALEHLTGPCRGTMTWLWQPAINLWLNPEGYVHLFTAETGQTDGIPIARLHRAEDSYVIEAAEGQRIWVNGQRVSTRLLKDLDTIEFGENGPISRCNLYDDRHRAPESVGGILSDTVAYFRSSRQPLARRLLKSLGQALGRLTRETTILFRLGVVLALLVLAGLAYQQNRMDAMLQQQIASGVAELEGFSRVLARSREDALTPRDLEALSQELQGQLATASERVTQLERRSEASTNVIAQATPFVLFLQGAYGFRETASGRMLRRVLDANGRPVTMANGLPMLSLDGEGPVAERQLTGTGFVAGPDSILVTNRHVGMPWEQDANITTLVAQGLEPVMTRFIGFMPGRTEAVNVELVAASEVADVAILRPVDPETPLTGLRLASQPPDPGDEVIVMGYPTGLRSMLAQAGEAFVEKLRASEDTDFWNVANRLAAAGRIVPLASRGIVGRASDESIVYDAETTRGGSGGPVLDINGEVVAVNAAILPEYGGSNLGVPIDEVRKLLEAAAVN
ncbi:MAG: serine protease [Alphaproteobacteria bacterium]|nr:serine protease [Alphaproteobacteria bacterium]